MFYVIVANQCEPSLYIRYTGGGGGGEAAKTTYIGANQDVLAFFPVGRYPDSVEGSLMQRVDCSQRLGHSNRKKEEITRRAQEQQQQQQQQQRQQHTGVCVRTRGLHNINRYLVYNNENRN